MSDSAALHQIAIELAQIKTYLQYLVPPAERQAAMNEASSSAAEVVAAFDAEYEIPDEEVP